MQAVPITDIVKNSISSADIVTDPSEFFFGHTLNLVNFSIFDHVRVKY